MNLMKLVIGKPLGFCFGVKRAIDELERALGRYGEVYALGSPIHNEEEVKRLISMGLKLIEKVECLPPNAVVFIRAHGTTPEIFDMVRKKGSIVIDGTCPSVKNAQEKARLLSKEGYNVVVVGDPKHPEVQSIKGHALGEVYVVTSPKDVEAFPAKDKIGVVSQTTQEEGMLLAIVSALVPKSRELRVYNTICKATLHRQETVKKLASETEGVIVIGGHNSTNTAKLVEVAKKEGCDVLWIAKSDEIDEDWLKNKSIIGIAAGASTPDWLINDVISSLSCR
ncbi:(E)-4-hydroxy-3-methyl-but-2-enyl pyrophosphate reductase [Acetomicrobium mobile DSM 13181]|uniref:4-hydroxy-3-methylbut-2-enyl diphosphate reductase n=2 Tax=Acetomicrobium TaxID=49894 RepID=I4BVW6_ACEMN|nr:(E)-4-hydroxy-3-methyl-but-2-enyl pyrophosphate reductase [Acetomicrobium mobile DSM 13181]